MHGGMMMGGAGAAGGKAGGWDTDGHFPPHFLAPKLAKVTVVAVAGRVGRLEDVGMAGRRAAGERRSIAGRISSWSLDRPACWHHDTVCVMGPSAR